MHPLLLLLLLLAGGVVGSSALASSSGRVQEGSALARRAQGDQQVDSDAAEAGAGATPPTRLLTGEAVDGLGHLTVAIASGTAEATAATKLFVEMQDGRHFVATLGDAGVAAGLQSAEGVPIHGRLNAAGVLVLDPAFSRCVAEPASAVPPAVQGDGAGQAAAQGSRSGFVCKIGDATHTGLTPEQAARRGRSLLSAGMARHAAALRLPSARPLAVSLASLDRGLGVTQGAAVAGNGGGRTLLQVNASGTTGTRSLLMVRVVFQGESALSNPWGDDAFAAVAAEVSRLAEIASYGRLKTVVTAVPCKVTIPLAYSRNPLLFSETLIRAHTVGALAAASGACQFTVSNFDHLAIYMRDDPMFGYPGLSSIPGSSIWMTGPKYAAYPGADATLLSHEYLHNLGVNHASTRDVGTGKTIEYGHMVDLMGARGLARYPAATTLGVWWKAGLGWVDPPRALTLPFDAMRAAGVSRQGADPAAPLDVSNSWSAAIIPSGGLQADPFTAGKAAYPVVDVALAATERHASTPAQGDSTAVDTIRIPDPTGLRETWTFFGFRRDNRLVDAAGGAEVASMGYGWAHPGDSVYPTSAFPALGLSTLVDPVPATESQTDAVIAPGQALVIAHPFAHVAGAGAAGVSDAALVVQVLSRGANPADATDANEAALNMRVTRLGGRGVPPVGLGCSADGSCQPPEGGHSLFCGATVSLTLTPGAPAAVFQLATVPEAGSTSQTATITTCTSASPAWSADTATTTLAPALAVFRGVFPSAQAYFGADISLGATDFSNLTLFDGSTPSTFVAKRCGTLTIPLNAVEPWYIVVAPSSSATPSFDGSFAPLPYTLSVTCDNTQACVRNAINVKVTGPSYGYLYTGVYRLNPVTPLVNSRPFWVRHDNTHGVASRYDLYSDSTGSWILYSYAADTNVVLPRLKSYVAGSVFAGLTGSNPTDFDIAISCACPEALYNANGGTGAAVMCAACGGLASTAPGSTGASACKCLPGAGFSAANGTCAICLPGFVKAGLSNSSCVACPSGTTSPGGAASIAACRATRSCDAVAVVVKYTGDGSKATWISGTYFRVGDADYLVNGYPVYLFTPPDGAGTPLYLAFYVTPSVVPEVPPQGEWRFTTAVTSSSYYATISSWAPIQEADVGAFDDSGQNGVTLVSIACTCSGVSGGGAPDAGGRCPGVAAAVAAALPKAAATPCPDGSTRSGCTACPTAAPFPVTLQDGTLLQPAGIRLVSGEADPTQCACPRQYLSGSLKSCVFPAYLTATFGGPHPAASLSGRFDLARVDVVAAAGSESLTVAVPVYARAAAVGGRPVYLRYEPRPQGASLAALAFQGLTYSEWVFSPSDVAGSPLRFAYIPALGDGADAVLPVGALPRAKAYDAAARAFTAVELTIEAATPVDGEPFSPSPTPSASVTRSSTRLPTRSATATRSPTCTRLVTPSMSVIASQTPSTSATPSSVSTASSSATASSTASASASASATASSSVTPSASVTVSASRTASTSASASASASASVTPSMTPSHSITASATASLSATTSASASATPTTSATPTPSVTASTSPLPVVSLCELAASSQGAPLLVRQPMLLSAGSLGMLDCSLTLKPGLAAGTQLQLTVVTFDFGSSAQLTLQLQRGASQLEIVAYSAASASAPHALPAGALMTTHGRAAIRFTTGVAGGGRGALLRVELAAPAAAPPASPSPSPLPPSGPPLPSGLPPLLAFEAQLSFTGAPLRMYAYQSVTCPLRLAGMAWLGLDPAAPQAWDAVAASSASAGGASLTLGHVGPDSCAPRVRLDTASTPAAALATTDVRLVLSFSVATADVLVALSADAPGRRLSAALTTLDQLQAALDASLTAFVGGTDLHLAAIKAFGAMQAEAASDPQVPPVSTSSVPHAAAVRVAVAGATQPAAPSGGSGTVGAIAGGAAGAVAVVVAALVWVRRRRGRQGACRPAAPAASASGADPAATDEPATQTTLSKSSSAPAASGGATPLRLLPGEADPC